MIDRRRLLQSLAAMPLLAPAALRAQDLSRIAVAPIQVRDSRVWMPVRFGEGEPQRFILDTGAFSNMIDRAVAARFGLRPIGSTRIGGVGSGVQRYPFYRAPDVAIGDVRVGQLLFAAYENLPIHPEAVGALSAGLLTVADSDLDFDNGLWRLHLDGRSDRQGFEALPSTIRSQGPGNGAAKMVVEVEIDGRTYQLEVDTGAPGNIVLEPAASRRSGLWNDRLPFSPHRRRGVGGDGGEARLVRTQRVRIGAMSFDRPIISLTHPGESLNLESDGLIGLGLIERMNLSTDVRARRLWARRSRRPVRPDRYGLSGLLLAERGGGVIIEAVGTGSPAAAAGLRPGDRLERGAFAEWARLLGGPPGTVIEIPYRRDGVAQSVTLIFREYL